MFPHPCPLRHDAKPSCKQVCLHLTAPSPQYRQVAVTYWFMFKSAAKKKKKNVYTRHLEYVCEHHFMSSGPGSLLQNRKQKDLKSKRFIKATIIRRHRVGTEGDGVPVGLFAITPPPLSACPL